MIKFEKQNSIAQMTKELCALVDASAADPMDGLRISCHVATYMVTRRIKGMDDQRRDCFVESIYEMVYETAQEIADDEP